MNDLSTQNLIQSIDDLLKAHGLRKTALSRMVLGFFLAHPNIAFSHAQLQDQMNLMLDSAVDKVTLYRLIDRLTQVSLLLCRVDMNRVRSYQLMPATIKNTPFFHCQSCQKDSSISQVIQQEALDLSKAAANASQHLASLGYQNVSYQLTLNGVCMDCAQQELQ